MSEHQEKVFNDVQNESEKEQKLLEQIVKKDAEKRRFELDIKQLRKERKSIETSRLWKIIAPIRKLKNQVQSILTSNQKIQLQKSNQELKHEVALLKEKVEDLKIDLLEEKRQVNTLLVETGKSKLSLQRLKQAKVDGQLDDIVNDLITKRICHDRELLLALKYAAKLYKNEKLNQKRFIYSKVLAGMKIEEIPEFIIREEKISLQQFASFRVNLAMRIRRKQLGERLPEWILDDKVVAYQFLDTLQVRRPEVSQDTYLLKDIPKKKNIVVKPVAGAGSRGVYLVFQENYIQDVRRTQVLTSWNDMMTYMTEDLANGWVTKDSWIVEELIVDSEDEKNPARDLKFYCFYGQIGLILEIIRYPQVKYCWWTATGERVDTGKYTEDLFVGQGVTHEEIELVQNISLQIPTPFIRIDFLKSSSEIVFGEFTPKPGNYDEFNQATDQRLGDYYLQAEQRLFEDLLHGKKYTNYEKLLAQLSDSTQA